MSAIQAISEFNNGPQARDCAGASMPLEGNEISIGTGFRARSFRAQEIGQLMDPLVMVDHYAMSEPTFGAHPHAGLSAVTLLFQDSKGLFHNRDSLGNDFDLHPGDLYWLSAGSGAIHDEYPRVNARAHGLQVFVNVPEVRRRQKPTSLLVRSQDMPVINGSGSRVRVALGVSNGICGATSPANPMTILDGTVEPHGRFTHESMTNRGIWVQSIQGGITVSVAEHRRHLAPGQALAIGTAERASITISNTENASAQFALFDGEQISENYVQEGPFVMGSQDQIEDIQKAYKAGELGDIAS